MEQDVAVHVVKIGGSLLTRGDLVPAIRGWVSQQLIVQGDSHFVLLVGGGPLVDALRQLDRLRPTDQGLVHWIAIEMMNQVGRLVGDWIPEWPIASTLAGLRARCALPGATLFLPLDFLRHDEPRLDGTCLPIGWQVTSDSIAARLAEVVGAERLTLFKSQSPPPGTWGEMADQGFVDRHFPKAAASLPKVVAQELPKTEDREEEIVGARDAVT